MKYLNPHNYYFINKYVLHSLLFENLLIFHKLDRKLNSE